MDHQWLLEQGISVFFLFFLITKRGKRQEEISFEKRNVKVCLGVLRVMPRESLLWKDSHKLRYVFGLNLKKSSIILFIAKFNWASVFVSSWWTVCIWSESSYELKVTRWPELLSCPFQHAEVVSFEETRGLCEVFYRMEHEERCFSHCRE